MGHEKVIKMAWMVSKIRSEMSNIPYSTEVYNELTKKGVEEEINKLLNPVVYRALLSLKPIRNIITTIEGRYLEIKYIIQKYVSSRGRRVGTLEIGGGYSPRVLEFMSGNMPEVEYLIHSDLPHVVEDMRDIVNSIIPSPTNYAFFQDLNVLKKEDWEKVGEIIKTFPTTPLIIISEGLMMYLSPEQKNITLGNIKWILKRYDQKGIYVTTDFSSRDMPIERFIQYIIKFIEKRFERSTKTEYRRFKSDDEAKRFIEDVGLAVSIKPSKSIPPSLRSAFNLNLSPERAKDAQERYRPYILYLPQNPLIKKLT